MKSYRIFAYRKYVSLWQDDSVPTRKRWFHRTYGYWKEEPQA